MANDASDINDFNNGFVDTALPHDVQRVCDLPSKVQCLFLGLSPSLAEDPEEIGLRSRLEGHRPPTHPAAEPQALERVVRGFIR